MALIDNLVSYWKLDESSGNAADAHGSNTLTNNNTTAYVAAKLNNGADFEAASSNFFSIADASQSGLDFSTALSVSMWFKFESFGASYDPLMNKTDNNQESWIFTYRNGTNTLRFDPDQSGNGTTTEALSVSWTPSTATWYHIVMAWDGSDKTARFYVNGSQQGTDQVGTVVSSLYNGTAPFQIGQNPRDTSVEIDGVMDEVGVWSRRITSAEVTSLYNGGTPLPYPLTVVSGPANVKTWNGLATASVKTINGLAIASVKTKNGLA